jgi:hypothetical protein
VANVTTDIGVGNDLLRLVTECFYLYLALFDQEGRGDPAGQFHVFTGIGALDGWDWTGPAKIGSPIAGGWGISDQAAFFEIPPAVIFSKEKLAFCSGWCTHGFPERQLLQGEKLAGMG